MCNEILPIVMSKRSSVDSLPTKSPPRTEKYRNTYQKNRFVLGLDEEVKIIAKKS